MRNRVFVALALLLGLVTSSGAQSPSTGSAKSATPDSPALTRDQALWLATMPLACLDRPHAAPSGRWYLWEATYRPPDDYQRNLAFYGCFDWHSSVNSI